MGNYKRKVSRYIYGKMKNEIDHTLVNSQEFQNLGDIYSAVAGLNILGEHSTSAEGASF